MNVSKHMEFIFLGALALIGVSAAATAAVPALMAPLAPAYIETVQQDAIQTVVVTAKRLSAEEKAALAE